MFLVQRQSREEVMTIQFEFPNEGPYFIESFKFNAGEVQVTIPEGTASAVSQNRLGTVTARIHSSDDLMELVMVTDAYKRINPMAMYTPSGSCNLRGIRFSTTRP